MDCPSPPAPAGNVVPFPAWPTPPDPPWHEAALDAGYWSPQAHAARVMDEAGCVLVHVLALAYEHLPAEHAATLSELLEQRYGAPIPPPSPELELTGAQVALW